MLRNLGRFVSSAVGGGTHLEDGSGPAPQVQGGGSNNGLLDENNLSEVVLPIGGRNVRVVKKLGEGGYAVVYLAQDIQTGAFYALKHMYAPDLESQQLQEWECSVMKAVQPPKEEKSESHVIGYYGAVSKPLQGHSKEYYILMDYCRGGDLAEALRHRRGRPLPEKDVCLVFEQVCQAIQVLHKLRPPIAHRDIKLENILILEKHTRLHADGGAGDYTCKLIDYGSATSRAQVYETPADIAMEEDRVQKHCTPSYRAPELVDLYTRQLVNEKVDVWAMGCVLYLLAFQKHAFDDGSPLAIINGRVEIPESHTFTAYVPALINRLLVVDPAKRPSLDRVLDLVRQWKAFLEKGGNRELADQKLKKLNEAVQQQQKLLQDAERRQAQKQRVQQQTQQPRPSSNRPTSADWGESEDWNPFGGEAAGKPKPEEVPRPSNAPLSFVPASAAPAGPPVASVAAVSPEAGVGESFDFSAFAPAAAAEASVRSGSSSGRPTSEPILQFSDPQDDSEDDAAFGLVIEQSQQQRQRMTTPSAAESASRSLSQTVSACSQPHIASSAFLSDFGIAGEEEDSAAPSDQPRPLSTKPASDQDFATAFAEFNLEDPSSSPGSFRPASSQASSSPASQSDDSRIHIKLPKQIHQVPGPERRRRKSRSLGYTIGMPKTPMAGGALAPGECRRRRGSQSQPGAPQQQQQRQQQSKNEQAMAVELDFQSFDEQAAFFK